MATKQNFFDPSRRRLEFDDRDCDFISVMKTPSKTTGTNNPARNRLPLTPVNYAEAQAKPRPQFMPASAMNPPSRLPAFGGLKAGQMGKQAIPSENDMAGRNMKVKSVMDSAKMSACRKPLLTKGSVCPSSTTASALRTASRAEVHARQLDSAKKRTGTRLFAPPQPLTASVVASAARRPLQASAARPPLQASAARPALQASAARPPLQASAARVTNGDQAFVGAPLTRFGSVCCMSRIPVPKATPSASTTNINSIQSSAAKNGSPANRAVSMLDLTIQAQEHEPLVPMRRNMNMKGLLMAAATASTLSIDKLLDDAPETPVSHGAQLAAETSISLPNGLNDEDLLSPMEPKSKPPRCSVSMTNLLQFPATNERAKSECEADFTLIVELRETLASTSGKESNMLLCDTKKDPLTPTTTPDFTPAPTIPQVDCNAGAKVEETQLQLDLTRCRDELKRCQADLATAQLTISERDARIRELELTVATLEEYNDNCKAQISEEESKAKEALGEVSRMATELHVLRADRARLESEIACERGATYQVDEARQEADTLRRDMAALSQRLELLTLESARVAAAKDEVITNEKRTVTALRGELESARRSATAKVAELRAEVEGALAARDAVRFELEKLQIAYSAACADRDTAVVSSASQSQELAEAKRRISALSIRNDDELQRTLVTLRGDVERLTRENAALNTLMTDRVECIANEFDTLMRTISSSNEERALLERSTFAPDRTLNASVMLNASIMSTSRYTRAPSNSGGAITLEKLERLVAEQFASQKQIADRDCTIGRLRDQLKTAEFSRDKFMRELRSLEKLLIRIFRRLQHNVDSMNDECKQLIAELSTLLRDRAEREEAATRNNEARA